VCNRYVVALVVTLEALSALSVGLCLAHMVTDKQTWLERLEAHPVPEVRDREAEDQSPEHPIGAHRPVG
jgi:hypothetical protein